MIICALPGCEEPVPPSKGNKPRKFCGKACTVKSGNRRRAAKNAAAVKARPPGICRYRNCRKPFEQRRKDREFCDGICKGSEQGLRYNDTHGHHRKPGKRKLATNSARAKASTHAKRVERDPVTCAHPTCDSGPFSVLYLREGDRFCSERCSANSAGSDWAARNPDYMRHQAGKRRAMVNDNGAWPISFRDFPIYTWQQWWLAHGVEMDVDHWLPIKLGGAHSPENLTLLLASDNGHKSAKHPADWDAPAYYTDLPEAA